MSPPGHGRGRPGQGGPNVEEDDGTSLGAASDNAPDCRAVESKPSPTCCLAAPRDRVPLLHEMPAPLRQCVLEWCDAVALAAWQDGYAACEADIQAFWTTVAERIRALGSPQSLPYSVLAERRGQHERAKRARENERRVMFG